MLVLTRKVNESITIDGGIEVLVVAVHGNRVKLGFRAPGNVAIQRTECLVGNVDLHRVDSRINDSEPAVVKPR